MGVAWPRQEAARAGAAPRDLMAPRRGGAAGGGRLLPRVPRLPAALQWQHGSGGGQLLHRACGLQWQHGSGGGQLRIDEAACVLNSGRVGDGACIGFHACDHNGGPVGMTPAAGLPPVQTTRPRWGTTLAPPGSSPAKAIAAGWGTAPVSGTAPAKAIAARWGTAPVLESELAPATQATLGRANASAIMSARITRPIFRSLCSRDH